METYEIVPQATAVSMAANLSAALDAVSRALAQAADDFDRMRAATAAEAIKAAALVMRKKDIASNAAILVARAEREIAKHNPPQPRGKAAEAYGQSKSPPPGEILEVPVKAQVPVSGVNGKATPEKLGEEADQRQMGRLIENARQAHQDLPDDKFDELVAEAGKRGEALSRQDVKRAANKYKPKPTPRPTRIDMTPAPASLNVEQSLRMRVSELEVENKKLLDELAIRQYSPDCEKRIQLLKDQLAAREVAYQSMVERVERLQAKVRAMKKEQR